MDFDDIDELFLVVVIVAIVIIIVIDADVFFKREHAVDDCIVPEYWYMVLHVKRCCVLIGRKINVV